MKNIFKALNNNTIWLLKLVGSASFKEKIQSNLFVNKMIYIYIYMYILVISIKF